MKLLVTRPMTAAAEAAISARFNTVFRSSNTPLTPAEAASSLTEYDLIMPTLGDAFRAETFETTMPRAKLLANFGAGYNHIDLEAAKRAGIFVTNTPDVVTDATAELAITLLLMTARRAGEGERLVRHGGWTGWNPTQMLGTSVSGRTVGIIGMGRIGRTIARRLHFGFDTNVVFYNRSPVSSLDFNARQLASITEVMHHSDFVVIAVPGGAETYHMIEEDALNALGPTGIIINIARGDIIDQQALIEALQDKRIRAAGLDVYEFEPDIPEALKQTENAVLLPHLGTSVEEVRTEMALRALDNLSAFAENRTLPDQVV